MTAQKHGVFLSHHKVASFDLPDGRNGVLRTFGTPDEDAEALFKVVDASRERLKEWLPWLDYCLTIEDERKFIERCRQEATIDAASLNLDLKQNPADSSPAEFSATMRPREALVLLVDIEGEIAGVCGFNILDYKRKMGFIGYWLAADYIGMGIMTRAVKALMDFGFDTLQLEHIDISFAKDNLKSRAIPERLRQAEKAEALPLPIDLKEAACAEQAAAETAGVADDGKFVWSELLDFGEMENLYGRRVCLASYVRSTADAAVCAELVRAEVRPYEI